MVSGGNIMIIRGKFAERNRKEVQWEIGKGD